MRVVTLDCDGNAENKEQQQTIELMLRFQSGMLEVHGVFQERCMLGDLYAADVGGKV